MRVMKARDWELRPSGNGRGCLPGGGPKCRAIVTTGLMFILKKSVIDAVQMEMLRTRLLGNRVILDLVGLCRPIKVGGETNKSVEHTLGTVSVKSTRRRFWRRDC